MFRSLIEKLEGLLLVFCALALTGCAPRWWREPPETVMNYDDGLSTEQVGGQDSVTVDLPFDAGYLTRCTQGVGGEYSHAGTSTFYDVDLDTPNDRSDPVFAPVSGRAYVHDGDPDRNFGIHVNIDLYDGTYIVLGHLSQVFVTDMEEVAAGQLIGYEGSTGYSSGDHLHLGRHRGFADDDAVLGESVEGLSLFAQDMTAGNAPPVLTEEMVCSLEGGHTYASALPTSRWHPNGTLVKTPDDSRVYLLEGEKTRYILTEDVFWQQNYDFADVALITDEELACYDVGEDIGGAHSLWGVYDGTTAWLLFDNDGREVRYALPALHWQEILASWGIEASTYDDLLTEEELGFDVEVHDFAGDAVFRDGTLLREESSSTVYVVSDGIAMPIFDWDTYLLMGFGTREILWVDDGVVAAVQGRVGDCRVNSYCLTREDIVTCGGPEAQDEGVFESSGTEEASDDPETDSVDEALPNVGGAEDSLTLIWSMVQVTMDRITLSGEIIQDGVSQGWQQLGEVSGVDHIEWEGEGFESGDTLRFSVEFDDGGAVSWSCLAPFPPGTVQGLTIAEYQGLPLVAYPADDPASAGCGLLLTVP